MITTRDTTLADLPALGVRTLIGMHFDHNEATRRLNRKFSFEQVRHLPGIDEIEGE